MKHFISFLLSILMLASCAQKQEAMLSVAETKQADSLALHVALMPTLGCLPIYYAQLTGITDSLDLDIRLLRYSAHMDIDTAIIRGHADIAYSDIIRAIRLSDSISLSSVFSIEEPLTMVAQKGKKIKKLSQMNEKMVAICRLCATDYWCEKMIDSAKISQDSIYKPQINDVKLRGKMMCTGLLEGAMLEEPYASWAIMDGNKKLERTGENSFQFAVWVITDSLKKDNRKKEQIRKFISAYKIAVENINKKLYADSLRSILLKEYELPAAIVDSLKLAPIKQPLVPQRKDIEEAVNWLSGRGITHDKFSPDAFINTTLSNQ